MNFTNILSTVIVICTIGCASAFQDRVDFAFSVCNHGGFTASAQYLHGTKGTYVWADNMEDFKDRVNENFDGIISFSGAERGSFDLKENTNYVIKPNKEGLHEYLMFNGVKFSDKLYGVSFTATENYQPILRLNFESAQDAKIPHMIGNFLQIINLNIDNPSANDVIKLKNLQTNCPTGLSYNAPLYTNSFKYNNYKNDFRELCMTVGPKEK